MSKKYVGRERKKEGKESLVIKMGEAEEQVRDRELQPETNGACKKHERVKERKRNGRK